MKVAFFETSEDEIKVLTELLSPLTKKGLVEAEFFSEKIDTSNIDKAKDAEALSVFVYSEIKQPIIDQLPKLKYVTTRSTGFDHIDIAYCLSRSITVSNVPAYGSRTVAEFTFTLLLGLSRKAFLAYNQIKEKHDFDYSHFKGFNLMGKTIGIIGTGRIGGNVAQIAHGFGMNIIAYDPFPNEQKAKELGFTYMSLDEVLANADVVTLHVPYNKGTHHLINKNNIKKFKRGAILINTSRGEIIETDALLIGLNEKILSGVGMDVMEGERAFKEEWIRLTASDEKQKMHTEDIKVLLENHMLMDNDNVAITPHIAFFTDEAKREIMQTTIDNLNGFTSGKPVNQVLKQ
jgi:D-lactate dehydrogenase